MLEQITHLGGTHAYEHFHKLRAGNGEEGYIRLAGDGLGKQRLAGTRRAHQQRALGHHRADLGIFAGIVQKVDDLAERVLRLILSGHILKLDAGF